MHKSGARLGMSPDPIESESGCSGELTLADRSNWAFGSALAPESAQLGAHRAAVEKKIASTSGLEKAKLSMER